MASTTHLRISDLDSSRFGLRIARARLDTDVEEDAFLAEIKKLSPDVVIFRCPAGDSQLARSLLQAGLIPFHADTLVYYSGSLATLTKAELAEGGETFRIARSSDAEDIKNIARTGFMNYRSHYHSNPLFAPAKILEGYVEWASSYVRKTSAVDGWAVESDGGVIGFATCCTNPATRTLEIPLVSILPNHSGRGTYTRLIGHLMREYQNAGAASISVSTQVWNFPVQRAWIKLGLRPSQAVDTYHLNLNNGSIDLSV